LTKILENKNAIVTGGSRGIGRAICLTFAREGANVVFTYMQNDKAAEETMKLISEFGVKGYSMKGDGRNPEFAASVAEKAKDVFPGVDILVNNAGITRDGLLLRMKAKDFEDVIDSNLTSAFHMLSQVGKMMIKARSGSIINMSSVAGIRGNAGQINYSASKAGLIGLTLSAAKELAPRSVRVNAIAPGLINTDMAAALTEEQIEKTEKSIGLGRLGEAEDVAELTLFLASEKSSYITGQIIGVDGGIII